MKTKLLITSIAAFSLGAIVLTEQEAHADTSVEGPTKSSITLYKDQIPGTGTFKNRLAITSFPAEFAYANTKIPTDETTGPFVSEIANKTIKNYVALSDDRADKAAKWTLSTMASKLESGSNELGATYRLGFVSPQAYEAFDSADTDMLAPLEPSASNLSTWIATTTNMELSKTAGFSVDIPADGTTSVEILSGEQTAGKTAARYGVGLEVNSNKLAITNLSKANIAGNYTGSLTWTLSDGI